MQIRKIVTVVEEVRVDGQKALDKPVKKAACAVVFKNPFAGIFQEDLSELTDFSESMGKEISEQAVKALGGTAVESYGKGAIVGEKGELEHAAALLHPKLGTPLRTACGGGKAIIPSAKKLGRMGDSIDIPLHFKDAAFVRSHFDAMTIAITDAPKSDEILLAVAVTDGGRPHPRVGGLRKEQAKKEDGLR
jgi:hypothetical protein